MKTILATRTVSIPDGVKLSIKSRKVTVVGKRGELTRDFKHLNLVYLYIFIKTIIIN